MSLNNNAVNAPTGLAPFRNIGAHGWNGQTNDYLIASGYASNIFMQDPVEQNVAAGATGTIQIGTAAGGLAYLGVFFGCKYYDPLGNFVFSKYWPTGQVTWNPGASGNVPAVAVVIDDPNTTFLVQGDGTLEAIGGAIYGIAQPDIFYNASLVAGAGSTVSGLSGWSLANTTIANTATLHVKILRIAPFPTNFAATAANIITNPSYNVAEVLINNHTFKGGTGTVGPA